MKPHPLNEYRDEPIYFCDECEVDTIAQNYYEYDRKVGYLCDKHFGEQQTTRANEIREMIGSGFVETTDGWKNSSVFTSKRLKIYYRQMFGTWSIRLSTSESELDLSGIYFPITETERDKIKSIIQKNK